MIARPAELTRRAVGEWSLKSKHVYDNPFIDVRLDGAFTAPSGKVFTIPGFYDGENTWRVRFSPPEAGRWSYQIIGYPGSAELGARGEFEALPSDGRGFLKATPGQVWGFTYESGEPAFLLGDTNYELFGAAYCGIEVFPYMERRAKQGFSLLRVRVPTSHNYGLVPSALSRTAFRPWKTRTMWAWNIEKMPALDRFNLEYFQTVDRVVKWAEQLGLGLEMIMEAWPFEFPFTNRHAFLPEWEELWLRYLIARYDAFSCVYFWTLMNEYEYYPDGFSGYKPIGDRWAMRIGHWVRRVAQHGHVIAVHTNTREPAFAERFAIEPEAIDAILFQEWGTTGPTDSWLAAGIDEQVNRSLKDWWGSALLAEYGYEHDSSPPTVKSHQYCNPEHTRRGAWRGAFCGLGVIHGFENSWLFQKLNQDQTGLTYLLHLKRFLTELVPFYKVRPAPECIISGESGLGRGPLALSDTEHTTIAVYLPVGGKITLSLPEHRSYHAEWYDPRTGSTQAAAASGRGLSFSAPPGESEDGHPWDWTLCLRVK